MKGLNLFCILLPFSALAFFGCATPNKPYQQPGPVQVNPSKLYTDNTPYEKLRAVEFDEQGDLWSKEQLTSAREMIEKGRRAPLLVVFIHGWHNNASPDCGNLQSFNQFLKGMAKEVDSKTTQVEGVYIGWRGLAIERAWDYTGIGALARYLSFYSRKADTDNVAGIPLTRALYALATEAHNRGGKVIFVGHSFGARILEKSLAQAIIGQTSGSKDQAVSAPADLTLLINPASEAIFARRLKLALAKWRLHTPAIVSVTSKGDTDTLNWWGTAMNIATATKTQNFRMYQDGKYLTDQRDYVVHTAGHSDIVRDRLVVPLDPQPAALTEDPLKWNFRHASESQFRAADTWWKIIEPKSNAKFVMNEDQARAYWVMEVPGVIIHDHNDIFNPSAIQLFAALYEICKPSIEAGAAKKAFTVPAAIVAKP